MARRSGRGSVFVVVVVVVVVVFFFLLVVFEGVLVYAWKLK